MKNVQSDFKMAQQWDFSFHAQQDIPCLFNASGTRVF
jgi:hypothetical protein